MTRLEPLLPKPGFALDLGCGAGANARFLAERGWQVLAIDAAPEAIQCAQQVNDHERIQWEVGDLRSVDLPEADLVLAFFSLFFVPPSEFGAAWARVSEAVKPGGQFAGQFLGPNDDWAAPHRSTQDAESVNTLLAGWDVLFCDEVMREGKDVTGRPKRWHVFHVIARKPLERCDTDDSEPSPAE